MRKLTGLLLLILLLYGCGQNSPNPGASLPPTAAATAVSQPNELVVRIRHDASAPELAQRLNAQISRDFHIGVNHYLLLSFSASDFYKRADQTRQDPQVIFSEPNYIYETTLVPNDPDYPTCQYAPQIMEGPQAWDISTGSASVIIGVIDTGIDGVHPDLSGRLVTGYDFIAHRTYPPNVNYDQRGHGSHVAGIIGAAGNNGVGVTGVNWDCRMMPLKIFGASGGTGTALIAEAIAYATDHQAEVMNLSLGGKGYAQVVADAVNYALANHVTVIASMGNDGCTSINYPAAYQGVLAVGSTTARDVISNFSTRGPQISVSAPGSQIFSTYNADNYQTLSGTSMAAPQVAGAAALLLSLRPGLTPEEIKSQLEKTADDLGTPGFDETYGWGRINLRKLLGPMESNKYGELSVTVNSGGEGMAGVEIVVFDQQNRQIASTLTDDSGVADFYLLPEGSYSARLNALSQTLSQSFNLNPGSSTQLIFNL